ncbi:hypothetical protein MX659_06990 [Coriobacteriia bacterium Es71-Z0120]|uniref:hypothetical protein n=1 Tax=Parvivirga hydrogeniphila TaxID=2939460 RepID=UPI002260B06A|nr:hypothetical protein [Parvivirga hydrogeniphila]MCL4079326.1 hypothetical protein [Parvivirga hydrogeniphila]
MQTTSRARRALLALAILAFATLLAATTGCAKKVTLVDVSDPNALFHFKIRSDWQSTTVQGLTLVYASPELPKSDKLADTLTLAVYPSYDATDVPLPEQLKGVIERRSKNRHWKSYEASEPTSITVGGRPGVSADVSGTDANGTAFDARFYLVRTGDQQVGFFAVAPKGTLKRYEAELAAIMKDRWYWHRPESETTATP